MIKINNISSRQINSRVGKILIWIGELKEVGLYDFNNPEDYVSLTGSDYMNHLYGNAPGCLVLPFEAMKSVFLFIGSVQFFSCQKFKLMRDADNIYFIDIESVEENSGLIISKNNFLIWVDELNINELDDFTGTVTILQDEGGIAIENSEIISSSCTAQHNWSQYCGPSAPILEGVAAEEFLKTIEQNKNKKVPKELYDRAKESYKRFKVI